MLNGDFNIFDNDDSFFNLPLKEDKEADVTKLPGMKSTTTGGAGETIAQAKHLVGSIQKRTSSMGVYGIEDYMEKQGIRSLERIKSYNKSFEFSFKLSSDPDNQLDGIALYNESLSNKLNNLVISFKKSKSDKETFYIVFSNNSLRIPYMAKGKKESRYIIGLQVDRNYDVLVLRDLDSDNTPDDEKISDLKSMDTTSLKLSEIGIKMFHEGEDSEKLSTKKWVKVKGSIDDVAKLSTDVTIVTNIKYFLEDGNYFYAQLSSSDSDEIKLSLSQTNPSNGKFLVIEKSGIKNPENPESWKGNVIIKQNAFDKTKQNITLKLVYLEIQ